MRPSGRSLRPAMRLDVILHEAREERLRDAEADRAGGEIDVVDVLGARGIGLRALVAAEILELLPGLVAEQILDGVEDRARMRLHRDPVLGPQHREIERRHDRRERGRGGLVPADLQAVAVGPQVVGVVDRPASRASSTLRSSSARKGRRGSCVMGPGSRGRGTATLGQGPTPPQSRCAKLVRQACAVDPPPPSPYLPSTSERVAQPVEHLTFNQEVLGSSPSALTNSCSVLSWLGTFLNRLLPCALSMSAVCQRQ